MSDYKSAVTPVQKRFLTATDVAEILDVSRSTAYRIIKRLNAELNKAGKITVPGKISAKYFTRTHTCNLLRKPYPAMMFFQIGGEIIANLQRRKDRVMVLQICLYGLDRPEKAEKENGIPFAKGSKAV